MKVKLDIDLDEWNPEDEDFQSCMKEAVIKSLANSLRDTHMREVMNEIAKSCVEEARLLIQASIRNVFDDGIVVEGEEERQSMQEMVRDKLKEWRGSREAANQAWNKNNRIDTLQSLLVSIIQTDLNKETKIMLKEVETNAIKTARENIAATLATRLFDGKDLLRLG